MRTRLAAVAGLLVLAATLAATLAACGDSGSSDASDSSGSSSSPAGHPCTYTDDGQDAAKKVDQPSATATESGDVPVTISTSVADLAASLDATAAPCTVHSFLSLADQGYFDKTQCHRLTTGGIFVLQCGDPTGTGSGGPGYSFDDELTGKETYGAGTLAMANAGPDTNGSQFFIVYADSQLGPDYTVFGHVDDDAVAQLVRVAEAGTDDAFGPGDGHPRTPVEITRVTTD